jgi:hypothetical protein
MLALVSVSSHSAETIHGEGPEDEIQIAVIVRKDSRELRLPGSKIRRKSELVFEIAMQNEREAYQLEQTINPNNSDHTPCSHEPDADANSEREREMIENNVEHSETYVASPPTLAPAIVGELPTATPTDRAPSPLASAATTTPTTNELSPYMRRQLTASALAPRRLCVAYPDHKLG